MTCDLNKTNDNKNISFVNKTKCVGVVIDDKLCWKDHVSYISSKVARGVGMFIKARQYLNRNALVTLYYSFIYPYLTYCNHLWGATYPSTHKGLVRLQNTVVRIICGARRFVSTDYLFNKLGLLKFSSINVYLISKFMYRKYNNEIPNLCIEFNINRDIHEYNTRQSTYYHVPRIKSNLGKFNIRFRGTLIWNRILSLGIDPCTSEAVFMKAIKNGCTQ